MQSKYARLFRLETNTYMTAELPEVMDGREADEYLAVRFPGWTVLWIGSINTDNYCRGFEYLDWLPVEGGAT